MQKLGEDIERAGLVLSGSQSYNLLGVHISNSSTGKATVFINPFAYAWEGYGEEAATPDAAASMVWHTIKHEILHDKIKGHPSDFSAKEAELGRALAEMEIQAMLRLRTAYEDPDTGGFRPGINRALQIYRESRGREERETDPFGGEESRHGAKNPKRKPAVPSAVGGGREKLVSRSSEPTEARE